MYFEKRILREVNEIDISIDYEIICYSDRITIDKGEIVSGNINYFKRFENRLLVEINDGESVYIYNLEDYSKFRIEKQGEFLTNKIILLGYWNDTYTMRLTKAIDFTNKNSELWESERTFAKTFVFNNNFFSLASNLISLNEIVNSRILWQYDLTTKYNWKQKADYIDEPPVEKQAEVIKFLGVYKNELWMILNSGALLALNTETGEESRYIKNGKMILGESEFEDFKGYFGYDTVLDEKDGLIFNLSRHFYAVFDINSKNDFFDSYSFKESSIKHKLNLNYIGGHDADRIFAYEGSDNNRFAVFDRAKKEIIWSGEIEDAKNKFPAIRSMKYGGDKIYVLDHNSTLHIFERE
ncbi:hypothetical protein SOM12_00325 [Flavobacterium sp. CFBP9031]|jgi:hypothetical protein|uniref:hypothetical protein n=1 Tax=Flavobacterium sp. CFBP9031 TaxID=3096538 RepID=UPI002A6A2F08|nr:hypothetical protein [Flavobacterium sp. CFBP9031]MDY0985848.1 hypothetical protein [Flavobacterium sp. CFBP9031]